jgi:hypothetical protein
MNGVVTIACSLGAVTTTTAVEITGYQPEPPVDYVHDVMPVLSKIGCNSGTCHGAQAGKGGFKLSLRGYDPLFDVRAFNLVTKSFIENFDRSLRSDLAGFRAANTVGDSKHIPRRVVQEGVFVKGTTFVQTAVGKR